MIAKDLVENQYHDFDSFLEDVDMVVVMVGHSEIKNNLQKLEGKIVLDTRNVCGKGVYKI
jgi:UDP-N-acetyl-D-mannosaminuronic acid dehydrogenase